MDLIILVHEFQFLSLLIYVQFYLLSVLFSVNEKKKTNHFKILSVVMYSKQN